MKNTKGQMHVLEVLLVATLFTSTVNVAVNILPTSDANNVDEYNLYFTGLEILEVLDEWVPSDSDIAEDYDDWVDDTGVQLIAVSIDDARSTSRVEPYVNAQGWDYQVLLDPNGDLKRAMNVNNVPHTFLVKNGAIVWDHNNYSPGDEKELYKEVLKFAK